MFSCVGVETHVVVFICIFIVIVLDVNGPLVSVLHVKMVCDFLYRGTGHWLTDVTPLIPLLNDKKCVFTMKTVPWAMPWMTSLNLRFSHSNKTGQNYFILFY